MTTTPDHDHGAPVYETRGDTAHDGSFTVYVHDEAGCVVGSFVDHVL